MHVHAGVQGLTGREREVARAVRAAATDLPGSGALVVLSGEAGIGKTTAARQILDALPDGLVRVSGSPLGHVASPALWPWRQVVRGLAAQSPDGPAAALLATLDSRAHEDRAPDIGVVEAFADALLAQARLTPLVVLLEDLHRFDELSLVVLEALAGRLSSAPLVVVACVRADRETPAPVRDLVTALAGSPLTEVVALGALPEHALAAAVGRAVPRLGEDARVEAVRLCAGNPLLAVELARAFEAAGRDGLAGHGSLARLVEARVRAVDEGHVLTALALLGRPATVSLLGAACGVPGHTVTRIVEHAARAGLVRVTGTIGLVEFEHPLFADGVAAAADPVTVQSLHGRLAGLVAPAGGASGPEAVERARHLVAAGESGTTTAVACLAAALHEERAGSPETALELVAHGLDCTGDDVATRAGLLRTRGRCLARGNDRLAEAVEALRQAVALARDAGGPPFVHAVLDLGYAHPQMAAADPAWRELLDEAVAATGPADPDRAHVLALQAEAGLFADPERSRAASRDALAVAAATGDVHAEAAALGSLVLSGYSLKAVDDLALSVRRFERHGAAVQGLVGFPQCTLALGLGDRVQAEQAIARVLRAPSFQPLLRRKVAADLMGFGLAIATGDAAAVRASARDVLSSPLPEAVSSAAPMLRLWQRLSGEDLSCEPPAAGPGPSGMGDLLPASHDLLRTVMLLDTCLPLLTGEQSEPSFVAALAGDAAFLREPADDLHQDLAHAVAALAGAALGDVGLCRSAADALAPQAGRFVTIGYLLVVGPAGWFAALALDAAGGTEAALEANAVALEACRAGGFDAWVALCLLQRARLAARRGRTPSAAWVAEAAEIAARRGLAPVAEQARALAPTGRRSSVLSPTQSRVLELAATGLTNDQIAAELHVARSTVEKHLTHAYRRFGVSNRAAAVLAWAAQRPQ